MVTKQVLCIKDVYSNHAYLLNHCTNQEEVNQLLTIPAERLFTQDKVYDVQITEYDEWRTKDDTCTKEHLPYNHIIRNQKENAKQWFSAHFKIL